MRKIKFTSGGYYHIYNRGADKRKVFMNSHDRWRFLQGLVLFNNQENTNNLLWQIEKKRGNITLASLRDFFTYRSQKEHCPLVRILGYCLMPNHYHLLIEELEDGGISKFMHKLGSGYTRYFNNKHKRSGVLFQGPFKAKWVDHEQYLQYLLVYINVLNPGQLLEPDLKKDGVKNIQEILKFSEEYQWGTHQEYLGKRRSIIIEKGLLGEWFESPQEYISFAKEMLQNKKIEQVNHLLIEN